MPYSGVKVAQNLEFQVHRQTVISSILNRLQAAASVLGRNIALMEVCGTHTMSAFRSGLHSLLPANVRLLSGPGCPVCVTAQSDIDLLMELARHTEVTVCTYGDMLRVPSRSGSLEKARAAGADVRVIYSTLDAVKWAAKTPERQFVLGAVGFETTAPATAAAVLQAQALGLNNFSILASHKLVVPAINALLEAGDVHVDGFLLPGHVSAIIGVDVYRPIVEKYKLPCVVSGFEELHMAGATVLRGPMGFGAHSRLHTAKVMRLSEDLPIVIEIVDTAEKIDALLPFIDEVVQEGLVTREKVQVIQYRANGGAKGS